MFAGAGLGYRIYNSAETQWSVQTGPGYRTTKRVGEDDSDKAAASISSNVFRGLTENSYVTNDTDMIYSEKLTTVNNALSLRASYTPAFNADQGIGDGGRHWMFR